MVVVVVVVLVVVLVGGAVTAGRGDTPQSRAGCGVVCTRGEVELCACAPRLAHCVAVPMIMPMHACMAMVEQGRRSTSALARR